MNDDNEKITETIPDDNEKKNEELITENEKYERKPSKKVRSEKQKAVFAKAQAIRRANIEKLRLMKAEEREKLKRQKEKEKILKLLDEDILNDLIDKKVEEKYSQIEFMKNKKPTKKEKYAEDIHKIHNEFKPTKKIIENNLIHFDDFGF